MGVLALQGDFAPHVRTFARLGVAADEVRSPGQLEGLSHLVLPGGESTTLYRLMRRFELLAPLARLHGKGRLALFGTCAGAILLGRPFGHETAPPRLALVDVEVERNAYGRQVHSRRRALVPCHPDLAGVRAALFIRAPRLRRCGEDVHVLARDEDGEPVAVCDPRTLLATYHPELDEDPALHRLFLEMRVADTRALAAQELSSPSR